MPDHSPFPWLQGLLLAVPLAALTAWLAAGAWMRSFGPDLPLSDFTAEHSAASAPFIPGFAPPEGDFPTERLYERVNGAADALRAAGCVRLLFWRIEEPSAEIEILVFTEEEGAAKVLNRDAGPERTAGPGDEASASEQSVFFRRGRLYARIFGTPDALPEPARLLELASRVDDAIQSSPISGLQSGASP